MFHEIAARVERERQEAAEAAEAADVEAAVGLDTAPSGSVRTQNTALQNSIAVAKSAR